jgi:hypothetical protein
MLGAMRRRVLVALVAVLLLAVLGGLFLWLREDPLETARRRVRAGMDKAAVVAAVGRPPNRVWVRPEGDGNLLIWDYGGSGTLVVDVNEDGKAAAATTGSRIDPTLWQRLRAWWPW